MSVYDPNRYTDLLQSGMDRLGGIGQAGYQHYQQEKALDADLPDELKDYIHRLLSDPTVDPKELAVQAANDERVRNALARRGPAQPAAGQMVGSVGFKPDGKPGVMPPGTLNPAAAQNPAPPVQPSYAAPQGGRSLSDINAGAHGAAASRLQGLSSGDPYVSGAVGQQAPGIQHQPSISMANSGPGALPEQGLGSVAEQALAMGAPAGAAPGPRKPLVHEAAPQMETAPIDPRFQMDRATAARNPQPAPQPEPQPTAPAARERTGIKTWRDLQRMKELIPTMEASRSRQEVAKTAASGRLQVAQINNTTKAYIEAAKQQGMDERDIAANLIKIQGLETKEEIAAMMAQVHITVAGMQGGAQRDVAGIRAQSGGDDQILKALVQSANSLRAQIAAFAKADKMFMIPGLNITLGQAEQDLGRYDAEIAKRTGIPTRPPVQGPAYQPPPGTSPVVPPQPTKPPAAPTSNKASVSTYTSSSSSNKAPAPAQGGGASQYAGKKLRVRKNGKTGVISGEMYNPKIHELIEVL